MLVNHEECVLKNIFFWKEYVEFIEIVLKYKPYYNWVQTTLFSQLISLNSCALTLILSQIL